jgi:hypothetical protein
MHVQVGEHGAKFTGHFPASGRDSISKSDGFASLPRWDRIRAVGNVFSSEVWMEMLGELELIRLIEENDYPARLVAAGVVWVELEITDVKTNAVRRERMSKSAFADLILDWRERRKRDLRELGPALRKIGIAA